LNINSSKSYGYLLDGCNEQASTGGCEPYSRLLQIDFAAFLAGSTNNVPTGDPLASGGSITTYTWTNPNASAKPAPKKEQANLHKK
jgi:hypothetical protein